MDKIGKVLMDRYEIEELIGSGGMARVYKAKCRQLNRYVAVKVLREELKDDVEFVEKFKTEALAAASLSHPNIVSVFDSGEDAGIYYFVMEYVDGFTLKQYISRNGALEWEEAADITLGICNAIEQAHKNNIVHRDIKPHNIMINSDKVVKVTDFGIAKAVSSSTIVRGGSIIGSVHYFSPEQARGAASTFKSDIYSIGIVFYEMLTGRVPFDANDPFNVAKMHVDQQPIEPKRMNTSVPASINAVVLKALAKNPEDRFENVTEMIAAIKTAIEIANGGTKAVIHPIQQEDFDNTTQIPPVIVDEPEEEDIVPKKMKKTKEETSKTDKNSMVMGIVIGVLIVLAVFLGVWFSGGDSKETAQEKVVDFVGMDYEELMKQYGDSEIYEFDEVIYTTNYDSPEMPDLFEVIGQNERAGNRISKNDIPIRITLTVFNGIKLKDYSGIDAEDAIEQLVNAGFERDNIKLVHKFSEDYDDGEVIRTIPSSSVVSVDKEIEIHVCDKEKDPEDEDFITVKDCSGLTLEGAKERLRNQGLNTFTVEYIEYEGTEPGEVVYTSPKAGYEVLPDETIIIYVSKEPKEKEPEDDKKEDENTETDKPDAETSDKPEGGEGDKPDTEKEPEKKPENPSGAETDKPSTPPSSGEETTPTGGDTKPSGGSTETTTPVTPEEADDYEGL